MRRPVVPRLYTTQLSFLSNLLRVVGTDKRLSQEQFVKLNSAVNEISSILSAAHQKALQP